MKFIKTFEELSIDAYAKLMDRTESFPVVGNMGNKVKADKMAAINGYSQKRFTEEFFKLYPKKETIIYFKDRHSTYELYLHDIKFNSNYTSYDLIFNTESGSHVWVKNPFYIQEIDLQKISILPVKIEPKSKELIDKMFNYGLSGGKVI